MQPYDFQVFLQTAINLNYSEIINKAEREAEGIDRGLYPGRGRSGISKEYHDPAVYYRKLLGGFLFFLRQGIKPDGISDSVFASFRPVIERLVEKGELRPEILSLFNDIEHN